MNNQDFKDLVGTVNDSVTVDSGYTTVTPSAVIGQLGGGIHQVGSISFNPKPLPEVTTLPFPLPDVINSPAHYARGKFEVWDIIEYFKLNYNLGNVCKYILRAGVKTKSPVEDYKKAIAYLQREVDILEGRLDVRPQ